nr:VENN motif pre-toxin domain-containing protein [Acinetobacter nosocomialis]
MSEGQLTLKAGKGLSNQQGSIISSNTLELTTDQLINNQSGQIQAKDIKLSASNLDNSSGVIAAKTGDVSLNINNQLINGRVEQGKSAGIIQAAQNIDVQTGLLDNSGLIYAGQDQQLKVAQNLKNAGQLAAQNNLNIQTATLTQTSAGSIIAGLTSDGSLANQGNLNIDATGAISAQGQLIAGGDLSSQAASHVLNQSLVQAKNISLNSKSGQLSAQQSTIQAAQQLNLTTPDTLDTQQANLKANKVQINAKDLNNQSGHIQQTGLDHTQILLTGDLSNQNGQIDSLGQKLQINANNLNNQNGLIQSGTTDSQLILAIANTLNNNQGNIKTAGSLQTNSSELNNDAGTLLSFNGFNINTQQLSNQAGQIVEAGTQDNIVNQLIVKNLLNNSNGKIQTNHNLEIQAGALKNNMGSIVTAGTAGLNLNTASRLDNQSGNIHSSGDLNIKAQDILNDQGQILAAKNAQFNSQDTLSNQAGLIAAQQQLMIQSAALNNQAGQIGSVDAGVNIQTTQQALNNQSGKIQANQAINLDVDSISTGLSATTSSGLGIATATLSPAASYQIGQYFKEQASNNPNGQLTSGQEAAHILAHTVLGAAVAAAGGNDAMTAGLSAGGAEAAAPILSSFLYGKDAKDLTADQKSTISSIVGLAGSAVGATTGDISSTVQSGQVAQNAVENNIFGVLTSNKQIDKQKNNEYFQREFACKGNAQCLKTVLTENALDAMKYAQKELILNGKNYKPGDIISNPDPKSDGSGLKYIVVNKNGVLKAEILPAADQVYYYVTHKQELSKSIEDMSFFSPGANSVLGIYGAATGQTLLSGTQLSTGQRVLSAVDGVSSVLPGVVFLKDSKVLSSDSVGMTWGKGINEQGKPWENYIQSTSPATTIDLNSIKSNFKAFDHFDPATGLATSDKTLNTAAKTYQDPKKITSQINKYIDQMDNFTGDNKGRFELTNDKIKSKEMQLAIPVNTSKSQLDAIQKSIDYANTKGITIKVTKVK